MKNLIVVIVLAVLAGGCVPTADQIRDVGDETRKVFVLVDELQDAFTKAQIVDAEKMDKINEGIDEAQSISEDIVIAMQEADYVDGEDIGNAIKAAQAANAASGNPYAVPVGAALTLAGIILEMLRRKEKKEKEIAQADEGKVAHKYAAHKQGAEAFRISAKPEDAAALYESIGKARARMRIGAS